MSGHNYEHDHLDEHRHEQGSLNMSISMSMSISMGGESVEWDDSLSVSSCPSKVGVWV